MSTGPLGSIPASVAGSPLAQTKGSEVDRARTDAAGQARRAANEARAEKAGGIGETDGDDHQTGERDADGRRPWEPPVRRAEADAKGDAEPPRPPDVSGQSGTQLDVSG